MKESLMKLIQFLFANFGRTSEPKKQGSVGFLIWRPKTFDEQKLDKASALAVKCGWTVIATQETKSYYDEQARTNKTVDPHIYVGPAKAEHTSEDDALAYALANFVDKD